MLDQSSSTGKVIAAARLTKEHGKNIAEFSMLVADEYQGEGLGGKLLRDLINHGKAEGLDAIEAVVMQTNRAMINVAEKAGFEQLYDKEEGIVKFYLNLTDGKIPAVISVEEMMKQRRLSAPMCI